MRNGFDSDEIEKDYSEREVMELLKKAYAQDVIFQQTEFNTSGGSSRADFVVLGENYFHYYEIKTKKDNLNRLASQVSNAVGLFTHMTVVASFDKIIKLRDLGVDLGLMTFKDIGKKWQVKEQKYPWNLSILKVKDILWAGDLRHYISERDQFYRGASKNVLELQKKFLELYTDADCFYLLKDCLTKRKYDLRAHNLSKNL